jgi:hypothetical protein
MWRDAPVGADMTILWQNFFATFDVSFAGGVQKYTPFNIDHFFASVLVYLIVFEYVLVGGS